MEKKRRVIIGCILICLFCIIGVYEYIHVNNLKNNFNIKEVNFNADVSFWTDNSIYNMYDIKFLRFDGTVTHEITSKKSAYSMEIDSNIDSGNFNIKIYSDKKILFESNGTVKKTITVLNNGNRNVMIEITGEKAKGHIKIKLT